MSFKTWGAAITSLKRHLLAAANEVRANHFGTPRYFDELIPTIHDAFVDWCFWNQIPDVALMRTKLIEESRKYPNLTSSEIKYLADYIPDKYNVRGVWTV